MRGIKIKRQLKKILTLGKVPTLRTVLRVKNTEDQGVAAGAVAKDRGRRGKEKKPWGEV